MADIIKTGRQYWIRTGERADCFEVRSIGYDRLGVYHLTTLNGSAPVKRLLTSGRSDEQPGLEEAMQKAMGRLKLYLEQRTEQTPE